MDVYGTNLLSIKLVTLAPELPDAASLVRFFTSWGIRVSLGHSAATYEDGCRALEAGATCLTHTLNCMAPLHQREPGLAGLITLRADRGPSQMPPFFTILADGHHVRPRVATLMYRAAPRRAILVSDSIELNGPADGTYPGHAQIPHPQVKKGLVAYIEGTDTLIGSCCSVDQCVRHLIDWTGCTLAEAVRCVTENVAEMMGLPDRGFLTQGYRADFVVLDEDGRVLQTWIAGVMVWDGRTPRL